MKAELSGPADTRMMRIVHTALRRDLAHAQTALTEPPYPDRAQRTALSAHLRWLLGFLHKHHEAEDDYLYPMVRAANPGAATLLNDMAADHNAIQTAMSAAERAAERYARSADARVVLAADLETLSGVLLPHLRREEDDMMPVVSTSITEQQWRDWEQTAAKPPRRELPFTANWLMDSLDAGDHALVAALIRRGAGPVGRWLVTSILVRGYRKAMFRCWGLPQHSPLKFAPAGTASVRASAPPEAVWQVLTDITRVGEWSHECHTASWMDGSTHAANGARFRGSNRAGSARWSRPCTIDLCNAPSEFGYRTQGGRLMRDSTEWYFALEPEDGGTRIIQRYRIRSLAAWADRLGWLIIPAHHDRRAALERDLERLAAIAGRQAGPTEPHSGRTLWPDSESRRVLRG
jgi:hemerythrin-like domain-containing protein